jgi:hypothetical protein
MNPTQLESKMIKDQKAAEQVCEYILDNDRELEDYQQQADENGWDIYSKNYTEHVYGAAREALGLGALEGVGGPPLEDSTLESIDQVYSSPKTEMKKELEDYKKRLNDPKTSPELKKELKIMIQRLENEIKHSSAKDD